MHPNTNHTIDLDAALTDVARIYRSITGRELPRNQNPVAPIPPEREPRQVAEAALEQLASVLERQAAGENRLPPMVPAVDCWETSDELVIVVDLPGIDRSSLRVEAHDGFLSVSGRRERLYPDGARPAALERLLGTYERKILLPRGITAERIDAELRNGVLHLRLSRKQGAAATGAIGVR